MDWLSEFVSLLIPFSIGWILAMFIRGVLKKHREIKKFEMVKQAVADTVEQHVANVIRLHVRHFNDCFYGYDADTEEFYAQGTTLDELVINLRENTKRSQAVFVSSDEQARQPVIDFLRSKLGKNPTAVGVNNDA